jgi:hypothetical protein
MVTAVDGWARCCWCVCACVCHLPQDNGGVDALSLTHHRDSLLSELQHLKVSACAVRWHLTLQPLSHSMHGPLPDKRHPAIAMSACLERMVLCVCGSIIGSGPPISEGHRSTL